MAKSGFWAFFDSIIRTIVLTMLAFSVVIFFVSDEVSPGVKSAVGEHFSSIQAENMFWSFIFIKSLDSLTPMLHVFDLPFIGRSFILLGDYLWPGWFHILTFSVLAGSFGILNKHFLKLRMGKGLIILLVLLILSYIIGSLAAYGLYYLAASQIGIEVDIATEMISGLSESMQTIFVPLMIFSFISLYAVIKIIIHALRSK